MSLAGDQDHVGRACKRYGELYGACTIRLGQMRLAHAGLYLLNAGRVEKLAKGWIAGLAVAVSPDGCRIAFSYSPAVTEKKNVLQAMSLCARR